ncbi:MAG TPA: hypothetical protein VHW00_25645 [Thermoanaerobaculia bacterium]|nr:hypothetical protein [Thermoanaerobaculia bacterium]
MKYKLPLLLALCVLLVPGTAHALQTDDLIAITAMPLAVADVVALPDVPRNDVMTVVTTLNRAAVPAPQFIEIVRYAPIAIVTPAEPRFTTYVTQEYDRGIVGQPLALAIADRYDSYGIADVAMVDPPVITLVEQREVLPQVVVTRFQPVAFDPLALIAMPLAVAAVADLANVPATDLMQFVTSLNQARVPAPQFVEVVRYSPVVFLDRTESPLFLRYVTTEVDRGLTGFPLAYAIANRIETYDPVDIDIVEPRPRYIVERDEILPPVVVTRVASSHPHGGAPGQLKRELGLQTGAEVVHGGMPNQTARSRSVARVDDGRERRVRATAERRSTPKTVRTKQHPAKPRVTRSEKPKPRIKSSASPRPPAQVEQRRPKTTRVAPAERRGNSGAPVVKQRGGGNHGGDQPRGNSGGGKGNKGKGKGKG